MVMELKSIVQRLFNRVDKLYEKLKTDITIVKSPILKTNKVEEKSVILSKGLTTDIQYQNAVALFMETFFLEFQR